MSSEPPISRRACPKRDLPLTTSCFKALNALTDGIVAGVVIMLSLLLILIAILCLRFTMLATIEEDYKEIGVMKAIGIAHADIKRIYLSKYLVMGVFASLLGYLASLFFHRRMTANILLYYRQRAQKHAAIRRALFGSRSRRSDGGLVLRDYSQAFQPDQRRRSPALRQYR